MSEIELAGWTGVVRSDGLHLMATPSDTWIIVPPDARPALARCPCCGQPFPTALLAKSVADAIYPRAR